MAISSLTNFFEAKLEVYFCDFCGHLQTKKVNNLEEYYKHSYNILIDSDEEDQLYVAKDGTTSFRLAYQADIFLEKIKPKKNTRLLDYGCAKAATLKKIVRIRNDIIPFCYDLSYAYQAFWKGSIQEKNCFIGNIPSYLNGSFHYVTSFFSLEHTDVPRQFIRDVYRLLDNDGIFLCVVPNIFKNFADLLVIDHISHFTSLSLSYLFYLEGFEILDYDSSIYNSALVITARKKPRISLKQSTTVFELKKEIIEIVDFWKNFNKKIISVSDFYDAEKTAIYGSGFYGAYLSLFLQKKPRYFLDQNPSRQGKCLFDIPIISPKDMPETIETIFVGLNPVNAKSSIEKSSLAFHENLHFIYIDP
ncbi:MAG: methyltransferase domain-containing protein [Pseudomonadota bacterium]